MLLEIEVRCYRWARRIRFGSQCVYISLMGKVRLWGFGGCGGGVCIGVGVGDMGSGGGLVVVWLGGCLGAGVSWVWVY